MSSLPDPWKAAIISATLNSFALDYVARQSVGGSNLNFFILKQLPIPAPKAFLKPCPWDRVVSIAEWVLSRVLELTYTAVDMQPFAQDLGFEGPPFVWDDERRFWTRAELDAAYFHIYGIERADVAYIMETFPIVKRKDVEAHGVYRTKDAILSIYDEIAKAIAHETIYQTRLDPPPANGWIPTADESHFEDSYAPSTDSLTYAETGADFDPGSIGKSERDRAICAMLLSGLQLHGHLSPIIAHQLLSHSSNPELVILDLPMEHKLAAELSVDLVPTALRTSPITVNEVNDIVRHLRNLDAVSIDSGGQLRPGPKFSERRSYFGVSIDDWMKLTILSFDATTPSSNKGASLSQQE